MASAEMRGTGISAAPIFLRVPKCTRAVGLAAARPVRSFAPKHQMLFLRRSTVALGLIAAACAPSDERRDDARAADDAVVGVRGDSTGFADSSVADSERSLLAGICLRGDPSQGEPWFIDRIADRVALLSLDALQRLPPRDSARYMARLARNADALSADTTVADFRGLPVVVRDAWRVVPMEGDTIYIAITARRLPMESNPLEEQVTLFAAPAATPTVRDALTTTWFARTAGSEDSLETRDPLLAFAVADGRLRVVLLRETALGPRIELLARSDGGWTLRWEGVVARCD